MMLITWDMHKNFKGIHLNIVQSWHSTHVQQNFFFNELTWCTFDLATDLERQWRKCLNSLSDGFCTFGAVLTVLACDPMAKLAKTARSWYPLYLKSSWYYATLKFSRKHPHEEQSFKKEKKKKEEKGYITKFLYDQYT